MVEMPAGPDPAQTKQARFELLLEKHKNAVYTVAYCATGDGSVSEDVAQEAFLQAWGTHDSLRDPDRFRAWICSITRNIARNESRRRKRHPEDPLEAEGTSSDPSAVEKILSRERRS